MTKEDIIKEIKEDCSYDSNYDYYIMTEQDMNVLADELLKKINYTRCCEEFFCSGEESDYKKCNEQCCGCEDIEKERKAK